MKRVKQFRYYGENNSKNAPRNFEFKDNWFKNIGAVSHLGVQATPGVRFYLNDQTNSIEVGQTGIYELNLENLGIIKTFKLDFVGLDTDSVAKYGIIVDVVYEGA